MSNTNTDYLYPEYWALAFHDSLRGQYQLHSLVSRKYESVLGNAGDSVTVPLQPSLTAADWVPGASISASGITQTKATVSLDKSKKVTINLTGAELSMSPYDLISTYGIPMAEAILASVDAEVYKAAIGSSFYVNPGTPGTTAISEDSIVDAGTLLSENKVAKEGRVCVLSPTEYGTLLKTDAFQSTAISGSAAAITEAQLLKKFGFNIFENNSIADYTPSDLTGAINYGAGYNAAAASVVVNGFADSANKIRKGDIFKTSSGTTYYVVQSTTVSTNTIGLDFLYQGAGLVAGVSNAEVLTFSATRSGLCFHPSAMAFAARPYAALPAGTGVNSQIINVDGLPIRLSIWNDQNLGLNVQVDCLFGVTLVDEKRMVRILC